MHDPVSAADDLVTCLEKALDALPVAGPTRHQLEAARDKAREIGETLRHIHENVVRLVVADAGDALRAAREAWRELPPGHHGRADASLRELTSSSPALDAFQRAGIRPTGVRRFSGREEAIAAALGDLYRDAPEVVHTFKKAAAAGGAHTRFARRDLDAAAAFFDALVAAGALPGYDLEIYAYGKKAWTPARRDKLAYLKNPGQPLRAVHEPLEGYLRNFVAGDWLTAFAAHIVSDHLAANGVAHEVLTMVAYEAPRDLLDDRSDLDVLVRAADRVLLVECKAGRVDTNGGGAGLTALVDRARGLERVLRLAGGYQGAVDALLVFNPHCADRAELDARLADTPVRAVSPDELRATVLELFRP